MEARFGKPHWTDLDSNGVGRFDAWALRFACGHEVTLWLFHQLELGRDCQPHELAPVEIHADDTERGHTCFHLGVDRDSLSLWEPDAGYDGPLAWRVRRQDDNCNQYELARFSSRCEAEAVARQFEARGHKQLYWVVSSTEGGGASEAPSSRNGVAPASVSPPPLPSR